jgi:predicted O-methyltransferase YrrM
MSFETFQLKQSERYRILEGSVNHAQCVYITRFLQEHPEVKRVLEIGFNGGLSSARSDIEVTSLDIGHWDYVHKAKALIDEIFPGRHHLVLGDSTVTLPALLPSIDGTMDMVFVDGGHVHPVPEIDLRHSLRAVRPQGWILMDDYCLSHGTRGVIQAWDAAVNDGRLTEIEVHQDQDRGWALGRRS